MLFFNQTNIVAPVSGRNIPLNEVNDEVFAKEMMGPGCAIIPESGEVVAPVKGKVSVIASTKHCIGITCPDGLEIMLHFGIDSYKTEGKGFEYYVSVSDTVKKGQPICKIDLDYFREQNIDMTTPIIILNFDKFAIKEHKTLNHDVEKGDVIMEYKAL